MTEEQFERLITEIKEEGASIKIVLTIGFLLIILTVIGKQL